MRGLCEVIVVSAVDGHSWPPAFASG